MVTLYTKEGCEYCTMAKMTLVNRNIPFEEKVLGTDFVREDVVRDFPNMKTFPIIVADGTLIGGFKEMLNELNKGNTLGKVLLQG